MTQLTLDALLKGVQSDDDQVRASARDRAGDVGAGAISPLAQIAATGTQEVARAANRAIQNIVYHAGRPSANQPARQVTRELLKLLVDSTPLQLRRDTLWWLWSIAGDEAVAPVAALLTHPELAGDARMALERIPGEQATVALQQALAAAAADQKPALVHSLRVRGVSEP